MKNDNELANLNFNYNTHLTITEVKGSIILTADNEEEEKLLANEIKNSIVKKIKLLSKDNNIEVQEKETRNRQTLRKSCNEFLNDKEKRTTEKNIVKYNQTI